MNLIVNIIIAILAFLLVQYLLGLVIFQSTIVLLISIVVAIMVFVGNPASRLNQ